MLDPTGLELVETIASASEGALGSAIFFGSRSSRVATNRASAYDLMLICPEPSVFYRSVYRAGLLHRSPAVLALFDHWLPPTQVRLTRAAWVVKASVVSEAALVRATSTRRKDQFLAGRLFQDVHVVWARDPASRREAEAAVESSRRVTLDWVAPDLGPRFQSADYVRQLFRTSFGFEVRPETRGRADALFEAQSPRLIPLFEDVLQTMVAEGRLTRNTDLSFSLKVPLRRAEVIRRRLFLEWSRVRATARWPKHAISFDGWLDYLLKKAERHSGETIVLSPLERRLPFIFLWPRVFRFLASQRRKGRPV